MGIWQKLFFLIFPPRPSQALLFSTPPLRPQPETQTFLQTQVTYIGIFTNPWIHAAVIEGKYYKNKQAHRLLGALLRAHLRESRTSFDYCIPIPLSRPRLRERGHNQVASIIKAAELPCRTNILTRVHSESQTKLHRAERIKNTKGAFTLKRGTNLSGQHIALVDDVVTTGATLQAAAAELQKANPASLTIIALAH